MTKVAIRTLCGQVGCKELRPCPKHGRPAWQSNQAKPARVTGRRLQRMRKSLMMRQPLCPLCEREGKVRAGTVRDHIVPLFEGGADDESNEQNICDDHHALKTKEESLRGRGLKVCEPMAGNHK